MFDTGGMAGQLARAAALITDAASSVTPDLAGPEAGEALREAVAAEQQLTRTICLLTERVDRTGEYAADGAVSMSAWLRTAARCSPSWAAQRVQTGRLLVDSLPRTRAAWAAGKLTFEHVQVIRRACKRLDADTVAVLDRALGAAAPDVSPAGLTDIAHTVLEHLAPETAAKDRQQKTAGRRCTCPTSPTAGI